MNIHLYNSLIEARNFLVTAKNNEEDLIRRKALIKSTPVDYRIQYRPASLSFSSNKYKHKDFSWGAFLFCIFIGIGVLYPIYVWFCNRKYRKGMREETQAIEKWENSPEGMKLKQEIQESIEKQQKELDEKLAEYKKFYADNYWKCLGFLPDWARKIETVDDISHRKDYIDGLIRYVKRGAATLDAAMEYYAEELREKWAIEERMERQERLEQLQKENIEALNAIAKNQEKTNEELERTYREKFINKSTKRF